MKVNCSESVFRYDIKQLTRLVSEFAATFNDREMLCVSFRCVSASETSAGCTAVTCALPRTSTDTLNGHSRSNKLVN